MVIKVIVRGEWVLGRGVCLILRFFVSFIKRDFWFRLSGWG